MAGSDKEGIRLTCWIGLMHVRGVLAFEVLNKRERKKNARRNQRDSGGP